MILNSNWPSILEDARRGELESARKGRLADPAGGLADYFYGRALAEAGVQLDEAIECLQRAALAEPGNPAVIQSLALALARSEIFSNHVAAAEIWNKEGLPLDLELLGQVSLTLEGQIRAWPEEPGPEVAWPKGLPRVDGENRMPPEGGTTNQAPPEGGTPEPEGGITNKETMPLPAEATYRPGMIARWRTGRAAARMEAALMKDQPLRVLELAGAMLDKGLESPELHLVAGLAAEEAALPERARAHLARADRLEPGMFLARTWLGRIYWRNGWFKLALALWRSIPVEGPYDYGRHYHLALGHEALGDRKSALAAMSVALDRFYFDTRHFYIRRALGLWQRQQAHAECGMRNE